MRDHYRGNKSIARAKLDGLVTLVKLVNFVFIVSVVGETQRGWKAERPVRDVFIFYIHRLLTCFFKGTQ